MLKYLTKDDLPESLGDIVDVIGLDSVKDLIKLAGGSSIYIPSENSVIKPIRNKIMKDDFNGSYKELSRKFGISEVQVRNIINPNS
ncbi:MAG: Mor transcription activator family protein [Terrisporobacter sp.]